MVVSGSLCAISPNFYYLVVLRSFFAFFIGTATPLSLTYVVESSPITSRGRNYFIVNFCLPLG